MSSANTQTSAPDPCKIVGETSVIESTNELSWYRAECRASPVIIKNCVATAFLGCQLDLREIAWKCYAEFDPRSFAAAKLRLQTPQSTALLFASGKIVCTGAASEESARMAVTKIYQSVSAIMPAGATSLLDLKIENIVGTAHIGHTISIQKAYEWMRESGDVTVMYSPELFPGMRFEIKKWAKQYAHRLGLLERLPETKVLVFHEGNVVITGGKCKEDLRTTWKILRTLMASFQLDDKVCGGFLLSVFKPHSRLTFVPQEIEALRLKTCGRKRQRRR